MSLLLEPLYTTKRGYYTLKELRHLALSLGYDAKLFERLFQRQDLQKTEYSDQDITEWLNTKLLDADLHLVFNRHSAEYNGKTMKKALQYLKQRTMTYSDIASGRRIFEVMSSDHPLGLPTEPELILECLKLVNKIISPIRLKYILLTLSQQLDLPNRIKLYEFFDILAVSENIGLVMKSMLSDKNHSNELDTEGLFQIDYQRLLSYLNEKYRATLVKPRRRRKDPLSSYRQGTNEYVDSQIRQSLVTSAQHQYNGLLPHIISSTAQAFRARTGHSMMSREHANLVLNRLSRPHTVCEKRQSCPIKLTACTSAPAILL